MTPDQTTRLPSVTATDGAIWPDDPAEVRPLHFGDAAAEYAAARSEAVVFDTHDRTQIVVSGSDAIDFLNNFCTAKLPDLQPGQGTEAFFPNIKARVIAHAFVLRDPEKVYLSADVDVGEPLLTHLGKYKLAEDVELIDATGAWGELLVAGPQAAAVVQGVLNVGVGMLPPCGHVEEQFEDGPAVVRRLPLMPVDAFSIAAETQRLDALWPAFAAHGVQPAGQQVYETLRIEAGWPQMGLDITDSQMVQEVARTSRAVSFTKGCYLGQEPIARLDAMGHTNRELRRLRVDGESPLGDGVVRHGEAEVGRVSSSAAVYGHGQTVALAVVKKAAMPVGTSVTVDGRDAIVEWFDD